MHDKDPFREMILANWNTIVENAPSDAWLPCKGIAPLGDGAYGQVYSTNMPNVVFKVTTDTSELLFVDYTKNIELPGFAKMYDYFEFSGGIDFGLWRERVNPIDQLPREEYVRLSEKMQSGRVSSETRFCYLHFLNLDRDRKDDDKIMKKYKASCRRLSVKSIVDSLLKLLDQGMMMGDIKLGNMGYAERKGKRVMVIMDAGMNCAI